ncbi:MULTISPECIES: guided entry of tail-anchored proteins factor 1 [Prauserella salsuginis group]|uniref:Guided entry of tail-anchored proteins factor 1 n=1 Tax=Prauserella salsuginis TaxID=387889 RepID=A0ABW6G5M4_9PSEU|nr:MULTISPECIES: guided entry of tail-anchored proteins factor 1 [Prauserella salsuginis group]MCR3719126.1 hypothetical protein [Prauserella flava]MCR3735861.1 hypothetical protein [Prauserella salsuginis]
MTRPGDTATDVALRNMGHELSTLRASMHDELAAMRTDIATLAQELRAHTADQGPRLAVLEHRADQAERAIADLESKRDTARIETRRLVGTSVTAVIVALLGWVPPIITWIGG